MSPARPTHPIDSTSSQQSLPTENDPNRRLSYASTSSASSTMQRSSRQVSELNIEGLSEDGPKFAKALYDFAANERDELMLEEEDIVQLLKGDAKGGWLFGLKNGVWGWFPANFVRMLTDEEAISEGLLDTAESSAVELADADSSKAQFIPLKSGTPSSVSHNEDAGASLPPGTRNWAAKYKTMPRYSKRVSGTGLDELEQAIGTHIREALARPKAEPAPVLEEVSSDKKEARRAGSFRKKDIKSGGTVERRATVSIVGVPHVTRQRWVETMGGVEEVAKMGLSKKEVQRQEVIHEIQSTEKDYVEDLEIIINLYMNQIKKNKLLPPKDMAIVFSNVEQLLPVNQQLMKWLEDRTSQHPVVEHIGDIFIRVSDFLKMYTMYCRNHPFALMKLQAVRQNKSVAKFLDQCAMTPESRNLNLANFLIKPVQRICKYPLLIREVMKNTEPSHPDFQNLEKALLKIQTVVTIVNEGARQAEAVQKMLELQGRFTTKMNIVAPWRQLLRSASMDLVKSNNERKRREIFLFNDMLLLAKSLGDDHRLKLVDMVPFDMILINIPSVGTDHLMEIVHINTARYTVACDTADTKQMWIDSLKEATKTWMAQKNRGSPGVATLPPQTNSGDTLGGSGTSLSHEALPQMDAIAEASAKLVQPTENESSLTDAALVEDEVVVKEDVSDEQAAPPAQALKSFQNQSRVTISALRSVTSGLRHVESKVKSNENIAENDGSSLAGRVASNEHLDSTKKKSTSKETLMVLPPLPKKVSPDAPESAVKSEPVASGRTSTGISHAPRNVSVRFASNPFIVQDQTPEQVPRQRSATAEPPGVGTVPSTNLTKTNDQSDAGKADAPGRRASHLGVSLAGRDGHPTQPPPKPPQSLSGAPHPSANVVAGPEKKTSQSVASDRKSSITEEKAASGPQSKSASSSSISSLQEEVGTIKAVQRQAQPLNRAKSGTIFNKPVRKATIIDVIRQQPPAASRSATGKDYVYLIDVFHVGVFDDQHMTIRHTYDDFFDFHMQLIGHFPEEAGVRVGLMQKDSTGELESMPGAWSEGPRRIIPELPGQMMFVSEAAAKGRMAQLQDYIQCILALPSKISRSPVTMNFFRNDGKHVIALTSSTEANEISQ
ncbi:hypothetical protein SpCBS45565_g03905 [Spizellomyces sp. 'palustris']|nr:hypothetical protein SpCBS45565_g03905 [Spizellomyces sp. 'palustris']